MLGEWIDDARARTLALVADLSDDQLMGPRLPIVNPLRWEIGHVAWFQEKWVLRGCAGEPPWFPNADQLYDSAAIPHDVRWDLPLPSRADTVAFLERTRARARERVERGVLDRERYFHQLSVFHEDMHGEAFGYARQTHGYPPPPLPRRRPADAQAGSLAGDAVIPGGTFRLGAEPGREPFVFDNEKWAHEVEVRPFRIARAAVTQAELAAFVDAGGYRARELWTDDAWAWRERTGAEQPLYWRREGGRWLRRDFDRWVELEPHRAAVHVNAFEAEAYCRWRGRRLPTELEWEVAASAEPGPGGLGPRKRRFPWGDDPPDASRANLGWTAGGCVDVGALPASDSAWGCRQMIGNVWEWTSTAFGPYPGFVVDPYKEYSQPWFGDHRVLRGGAWTTMGRLLRNTWRNFYKPDRRDVWAGFRTAADA